MRQNSNFKRRIGRRAVAAAMAALMLGSFTITGNVGGEANYITVDAASKTFEYNGNNIGKFKGESTVTISKNLSEKALASLAKAYKTRSSQFLKVKTVKFGDNVTKVSSKTFLYFPNVTTVSFGKKVSDIPESTGFLIHNKELLTKLKKFTVDSKNADFSAQNGVLYNKKKTRIVKVPQNYGKSGYVMPETVKTLGSSYALYECSKITSVTLSKAFDGNTDGLETLPKLKTIKVTAGNEDYQVENGVLYNKDKTKLICWPQADQTRNAVFPASLKSMNTDVLPKTLVSITLPRGLTQLYSDNKDKNTNPKQYPLNALPELKEVKVDVGNSKFVAENNVLYNSAKTVCYGIPMKTTAASVRFADTLKKGYASLLYGHTSITNLTFGKDFVDASSVTGSVFTGNDTLTSLKSITVSAENEKYKTENGVLYSKDMTNLYVYPVAKEDKEYVIPDTVTEIAVNAFGDCNKNLVKVTIGAAVKKLHGIELPALQEYAINDENDMFTVRDGVLYDKDIRHLCGYPYDKKDKEYEIPSTIESMNDYGDFANKNIKSLVIQSDFFGSNYYDDSIGLNENLPALEEIRTKGNVPFKAVNGVLYNGDQTELYCYPANKDSSSYSVPDSVEEICRGAMTKLNYLKSLTIGKKVRYVNERYNFIDAPKLNSIAVAKTNKYFKAVDKVLYNKKVTALLVYPRAKKASVYTLPKTVNMILCTNYSFYKNKNLKSLKVAKENKIYHVVDKSIVRYEANNYRISLNLELTDRAIELEEDNDD